MAVLVFLKQTAIKEQRIVGIHAALDPGVQKSRERMRVGRVDSELDVAGGTHVQADPRGRKPRHQAGVLDGANPVKDPVRTKDVERVGNTFRSEEFPRVRCREQATGLGDGKGIDEGSGREGSLVSVEAEAYDTLTRQLDGQARRIGRSLGSDVPIGGDQEAESDAKTSSRGETGVQHEPHGLPFGSKSAAKESRPQRHLHPHRPVVGCVLHNLADNAVEVVGGGEGFVARGDGVHEHFEGCKGLSDRKSWDRNSTSLAHDAERPFADSTVKVEVKMRLRQRSEITHEVGSQFEGATTGPSQLLIVIVI